MILLRLALQSLVNRWVTAGITVFAIALSVSLFLGVEKIRTGAWASFANTISDTDLIVGARSGSVQLLLYSVFRIGTATNNISWESYTALAERPEVAWIVPLSLGDSHRGFRVMGTSTAYFTHYKYRGGQSLAFAAGKPFHNLFDTVIGRDVADALGYELGDPVVISHGVASFSDHDDKPFRIAGILKKTGTPVDRTVLISLKGIEAVHVDWHDGSHSEHATTAETIQRMNLEPKAITAAMLGVTSKRQIIGLQRRINTDPGEPMLAILPGVALQELWQIVGVGETALLGISGMVVATALLGMTAMIFASLNERRREMAILRAVGAGPWIISGLLTLEAVMMALFGAVLGSALLYLGLTVARSYIDAAFGLYIPIESPTAREILLLLAVVVAGAAAGLLPAARAYRLSLADGMSVKN